MQYFNYLTLRGVGLVCHASGGMLPVSWWAGLKDLEEQRKDVAAAAEGPAARAAAAAVGTAAVVQAAECDAGAEVSGSGEGGSGACGSGRGQHVGSKRPAEPMEGGAGKAPRGGQPTSGYLLAGGVCIMLALTQPCLVMGSHLNLRTCLTQCVEFTMSLLEWGHLLAVITHMLHSLPAPMMSEACLQAWEEALPQLLPINPHDFKRLWQQAKAWAAQTDTHVAPQPQAASGATVMHPAIATVAPITAEQAPSGGSSSSAGAATPAAPGSASAGVAFSAGRLGLNERIRQVLSDYSGEAAEVTEVRAAHTLCTCMEVMQPRLQKGNGAQEEAAKKMFPVPELDTVLRSLLPNVGLVLEEGDVQRREVERE